MLNCLFSLKELFFYNPLSRAIQQIRLEYHSFYNATVTATVTLLDDFAVDLKAFSWQKQKKRSLVAWSVFSTLPTHMARSERICYHCLRRKRELAS
jgi:hypothetical protein